MTNLISLKILCFLLLFVYRKVASFNLDLRTAVIHRGQPDTYYGYSVAQHLDGGKSWLIVGAPLASGTESGIQRGGAVFRCIPQASSSCQLITFDLNGNRNISTVEGRRVPVEEKEGQWLGATVHTSSETGTIIACAPRYVFFSYNNKRRDPVGFCYVSRGAFTAVTPLSPCRIPEKWGYHRLGSCQAGFSASVDESGRYIHIGAVGSYYWQGKVFGYDLHNLTSPPSETMEGPQSADDSYMGYSITHGNFSGSKGKSDVAVGMPRGALMSGQIVVMTQDMRHITNITGDIMGTYFGYSLATADLNGDGLDDIVIGAPLYTKPDSKDKSFEHGRVYIAYQVRQGRFEIGHRVDGYRHRSRFGNSVTNLGDVNLDGYQDIAVGAPYDGPDGRGAVYIFNGGKKGISQNYSQVIYARDFNDPGLKTFGWSLSGGLDMDRNGYPDLAVGAFQSDRAVYLQASPIINLKPKVTINPPKISLKDRACLLPDGTRVTCFEVEICMRYDGKEVPNVMNFTTYFRLDHHPNRPSRAYVLSDPEKSEHQVFHDLFKDSEKCKKFKVYLPNNIRDKLTPIKLEAEYTINDYIRGRLENPKPVLNHVIDSRMVHKVTILKNCSVDEICVPDLKLTAKPNMDPYLIGTEKGFNLNITIINRREDAFETVFELEMPPDVQYSYTEGIKGCIPPRPQQTGKNLLKCDIGNPMLAKEKINFLVHLEPKMSGNVSSTLLFVMNVSSTNPELNHTLDDNEVKMSIPVRVVVNLTSTGASLPEQIIHNVSEILVNDRSTADDFGYQVTHAYTITNHGPSYVKLAKIYILWPSKTLDGRHLLYLLSEPKIDHLYTDDRPPMSVECERLAPRVVDPLRLPESRDSGSRRISNILGDDPNAYINSLSSNNSLLSRRKRYSGQEDIGESYLTLEDALKCSDTQCTQIVCNIHNFNRKSVTFTIRSRLSKKTISEIGLPDFQVSSKLVSEVAELPYGVKNNYIPPKVIKVSTEVRLIGLDYGFPIPLWIILLAILTGLLLLSLLALALWKIGFFKRKRPPLREDYEPLRNSNGYSQDDGETRGGKREGMETKSDFSPDDDDGSVDRSISRTLSSII